MYDPEYTHNEQIMAYQMPVFFEELSKKYTGKMVNVERDGDLVYQEPITDWSTLQSLRYYHVRTGHALYLETEQEGSASSYTIKTPTLVWVVRDQHRQVVAVQVIDESNRNIILRFKT
jgi:hypothetical protein